MRTVPNPTAPVEQQQHSTQRPRYGYLTPKQAAEFTNISIQELERLRREGGGPRFNPVGPRLIRYSVEVLCAWMDSFAVNNTSEARERKGVLS